ncbi:MAG: ATP-binding protein, partial [Candidatus Cloacimonetes bacterium]|nr:ATP-binding protein [Candidatus Cloacimonadota bacterium]
GGIGLAILKEFICLNKGVIQIVSDAGYYAVRSEGMFKNEYSNSFPGTMINLTFRTDDNNSYALSDEITDLF